MDTSAFAIIVASKSINPAPASRRPYPILGFSRLHELSGVDALLRPNKSAGEIGVVGFGDASTVGEIIVAFIAMGGVSFSVNPENKSNPPLATVVVARGVSTTSRNAPPFATLSTASFANSSNAPSASSASSSPALARCRTPSIILRARLILENLIPSSSALVSASASRFDARLTSSSSDISFASGVSLAPRAVALGVSGDDDGDDDGERAFALGDAATAPRRPNMTRRRPQCATHSGRSDV
jgi:hypothetical protein